MLWFWVLSFSFPFPILAFRAERFYRSLSALEIVESISEPLPAVTVIVPARNEEENLKHLIPSLIGLSYPGGFEIIIVDDDSSDRTAEIAESYGVRIVRAGKLPPGWHGKPHACHTGAVNAAGDWLLFTDADTVHRKGSLSSAVRFAWLHNLDGLSLLLGEKTFGLIDKLSLMTAYAALFAGLRAGQPVLNGQYILIRKDAYFRSGGFATVRAESVEDLAFAHLLHNQGLNLPILLGQSAGDVHMYANSAHLWRGLSRLGSSAIKWSGPGGWLTALFITGAMTPLIAIPFYFFGELPARWLIASWSVVTLFFIPWAQRSGGARFAFLAPFGALIVQLAAVSGLVRTALGRGVPWKGREV